MEAGQQKKVKKIKKKRFARFRKHDTIQVSSSR